MKFLKISFTYGHVYQLVNGRYQNHIYWNYGYVYYTFYKKAVTIERNKDLIEYILIL